MTATPKPDIAPADLPELLQRAGHLWHYEEGHGSYLTALRKVYRAGRAAVAPIVLTVLLEDLLDGRRRARDLLARSNTADEKRDARGELEAIEQLLREGQERAALYGGGA